MTSSTHPDVTRNMFPVQCVKSYYHKCQRSSFPYDENAFSHSFVGLRPTKYFSTQLLVVHLSYKSISQERKT